MSTAILQAMSMRIPVIASRVPGNIDFFKSIRKLSNTFLNEKKILSEKIYNCYKYYDKNKKELNDIKKLIDKNYSQKQMYKKYEKLIQRIIEKKINLCFKINIIIRNILNEKYNCNYRWGRFCRV